MSICPCYSSVRDYLFQISDRMIICVCAVHQEAWFISVGNEVNYIFMSLMMIVGVITMSDGESITMSSSSSVGEEQVGKADER